MGDVQAAKRALHQALGSKWEEYWALLRQWFRKQISKQQLDNSVRALLMTRVSLHTDFMLSILRHCQSGGNGINVVSPVGAQQQRPAQSGSRSRAKVTKTSGASTAAASTQASGGAERASGSASSGHSTTSSTSSTSTGNGVSSGQAAPAATTITTTSAAAAAAARTATDSSAQQSSSVVSVHRKKNAFTRYAPYPLQNFKAGLKCDTDQLRAAHQANWRPLYHRFLPSLDQLKARLRIHTLSSGLESADDGVAEMVLSALETHIKNVLTAVSEQTLRSSIPDLSDHDYVKKPSFLNPHCPLPTNRDLRALSAMSTDSSRPCRDQSLALPLPFAKHSGNAGHRSGAGRHSVHGVEQRIRTLDVYNAAQGNMSLFGGRSVAMPLMHRLHAML
ncbi:uncharacterized protein LOC135808611 [Sycon ciliatum]|uniref:uncharacterized protein LOC135808611 n=1 Tax=Sycon ciliatum TaxID=27933 RepID=UPI0031F6C241